MREEGERELEVGWRGNVGGWGGGEGGGVGAGAGASRREQGCRRELSGLGHVQAGGSAATPHACSQRATQSWEQVGGSGDAQNTQPLHSGRGADLGMSRLGLRDAEVEQAALRKRWRAWGPGREMGGGAGPVP